MDSDLVFLLAVGAFYLLRHLSSAKRRGAAGGQAQGQPAARRPAPLPPLPGEEEGQPDPEFDEALLEIRRALGMPVPETSRESPVPAGTYSHTEGPHEVRPRPVPSSPEPPRARPLPRQTSLPSRIPARPNRRPQRIDDEFRDPRSSHRTERVEDEFHDPTTFRVAAKPRAPKDVFAWNDPLADHDHDDSRPEVVKTSAKAPHPLLDRIKSREVLREALLLREILGPPTSRRGR